MQIHYPEANSLVPVSVLAQLNDALRKAATGVGYQTPASVGTGLGALVPQSLEGTLASATYSMKQLSLWPAIPKTSATQTVHEYTRVDEQGMDLDPFMAEGGGGATNKSTYAREFLKVKYLSERREVTDVATMVGLIGDQSNALAVETQRGTIRLMQKLEYSLFHAKESVNPLAFDGIFKQVEDGGNVTDLEGKSVDFDLLQAILGEVYSAPRFGMPDTIYVEPRVHADLIRQSVAYGRHDQVRISESTGVTYGIKNITIMAPYGEVKIKAAPFLYTANTPPTAASSTDSGVPNTPTIKTAPTNAVSATSKFKAADAGDYRYKIVAVTKDGYSAPLTTAAASVVAGEKITLAWDEDAASQNAEAWYRIYRSDKDSTTAYTLIDEIPANNDGAGNATQYVDENAIKPRTSKILMIEHSADIFEFVRLLDFLRRPLAEVNTTKPFLLMMFGAPAVKVPTKCWMVKNVGVADAKVSLI